MKKKLVLISTLSAFSISVRAASYYVRNGDTLSTIALRMFPSELVYGRNGSLARLIELNNITNPNLILVGQKIIITPDSTPTKQEDPSKRLMAPSTPQKNKPPFVLSLESDFKSDQWEIGANYGVKYFSYNLSGDLGKAEVAVTIPENYRVYSQYRYEDFEFQFSYERYKLKYEASENSGNENMDEFTLKASYKNWIFGAAIMDSPIFKNEAGVISLSKLSVTSIVVGHTFSWQLPVEKETHFELTPLIYYPVSLTSGNTDIKPSSPSGYMADVEAKLSRTIKQTDKYKILAVWPVNARYGSLSHDIEWGNSKGQNESNSWSVGTQIGLEINF